MVHRRRRAVRGHGDQRRLRDDHDPRVRVTGAHPGVRGDHRDQRHPRPHPRRRRHREAADPDAVGREHLRRLRQRLRPHRHALAQRRRGAAVGLHRGRGHGRHRADARSRRLHRQSRSPPRPDGKVYQLPDQQFANLYWFRYDWFTDPDIKEQFKEIYGYALGVPVNWSAYEDIANFFTNEVKDDRRRRRLRPHGLRQEGPVARLAVHRCLAVDGRQRRPRHPQRPAGRRLGHPRRGLPAGRLVGDPRRRHQRPGVGVRAAEVHRLAASLRATRGRRHDVQRGGTRARRRAHRPADLLVHGVHGRHDRAGPAGGQRGRHARSGAWRRARTVRTGRRARSSATRTPARGRSSTRTPAERRNAAWLYAQFVDVEDGVADEVDRRPHLHPRVRHRERLLHRERGQLGGLVEFYRSPARVQWTPTGTNVPDYPSSPSCGGRTSPRRPPAR